MAPTLSEQTPHTVFVAILAAITLWLSVWGLSNLPVIDRDEARYAQATVQMVESDDYLNIRFQDRDRHKKPAGIYWMQAAGVKTLTEPGERRIWIHRIPSVLGALLAVMATYWGTLAFATRRTAFVSAAILASSALLVFEAHIAKTDAMLCGLTTLALACMLWQRTEPQKWVGILFWVAMAAGMMIKGPITPGIIILSLITIGIWERQWRWMKHLWSWIGFALACLMIIPWAVMIWVETDGAFFLSAIGDDLAPKLAGGQEKHGAPPGYYLMTLPILFWPGILFLIPGGVWVFRRLRQHEPDADTISSAMRLLLAWIIPFWLMLELVPTKLPNYLLPTYPAMAMIAGTALITHLTSNPAITPKRLGGIIFAIVSIVLTGGIVAADVFYSGWSILTTTAAFAAAGCILTATIWFWRNRLAKALAASLIATLVLTPIVYAHVLPRAKTLQVSYAVEDALERASIALPREGGPKVMSPDFTEPSLVFRLGTEILLGDKTTNALETLQAGDVWLFDSLKEGSEPPKSNAHTVYEAQRLCLIERDQVSGVNYSRGDDVNIQIYQAEPCPSE